MTQPKYQRFAEALKQAMIKGNLSASEVARRMWGTTKDKRGYTGARNRDRIGHYLAGTSHPEPENLQKLADAIGVSVEELKSERQPVNSTAPRSRSLNGVLQITTVADHPDKLRLQTDRTIDWRLAVQIFKMLKEAELSPTSHPIQSED